MKDESIKYIHNLVENDKRKDGRKLDEFRDIKVEYDISPKSAEGSAKVTMGDTIVVAGVKLDVGAPFPDTPDKGVLICGAELLPLSNPEYELGPPRIEAIELSRVVDRGLRESGALDFKKLVIKEGEKVWMIFVDIYPINDAGNLWDAASLAAIAALKNAKFPKYDEEEGIVDYSEKTNDSLPLNDAPIESTIRMINGKLVVDPTNDEEKAVDARLTVAVLEDGNLCALQKGGDEPLNSDEINSMVDLAIIKSKEMRKKL
jgi:exosome complex component RRP42